MGPMTTQPTDTVIGDPNKEQQRPPEEPYDHSGGPCSCCDGCCDLSDCRDCFRTCLELCLCGHV